MPRRERAHLAALLVVAAVLLGWASWRVYPHQVNGDEWITISRPLWMLFYDPFIHSFRKGGNLHLHLLSASYLPLAGYWYATGQLPAVMEAVSVFGNHVTFDHALANRVYHQIALVARVVSVTASIGTVGVVYLLGRELAGHRAGLVAGFATTATPGFVAISKFAGEDAIQIFLTVLTVYLLVLAVDDRSIRRLTLASVVLGLAVSAKATSGLLVVPFFAAIYHIEWPRTGSMLETAKSGAAYSVVAALAYVTTTPEVLLWPNLWVAETTAYIGLSLVSSIPAPTGVTYRDPGWVVFLGHLAISMTFYLFVAGVASTLYTALKVHRREYDWRLVLPLSFVAVYSIVMLSPRMPQYFRLPILHPFLGVFVGVVLADLFGRHRDRLRFVGTVGLAIILLTGASTAFATADDYTTRAEATEWASENIEDGASVDVYSYRVYLPEFPPGANVTRYQIADPYDPGSRAVALRRIENRCPKYVGLTSYYYARFFTAHNQFSDSTRLMDILLNEKGVYEPIARFGQPVIESDPTPERETLGLIHRFVRSLDYFETTTPGDGNPTIVILERTRPPGSGC